MALSIKEQLDILKGVEAPESYTLEEYIEQIAIKVATGFFLDTKKEEDAESNLAQRFSDSKQYTQKMSSTCNNIIQRPQQFTKQLSRILVSKIGEVATIGALRSASDEQWINFLENNMLNSIEIIAGVVSFEKTAYDGIVKPS